MGSTGRVHGPQSVFVRGREVGTEVDEDEEQDGDKDAESDDEPREQPSHAQIIRKASLMLLAGTIVCAIVSDPMVDAVSSFSKVRCCAAIACRRARVHACTHAYFEESRAV